MRAKAAWGLSCRFVETLVLPIAHLQSLACPVTSVSSNEVLRKVYYSTVHPLVHDCIPYLGLALLFAILCCAVLYCNYCPVLSFLSASSPFGHSCTWSSLAYRQQRAPNHQQKLLRYRCAARACDIAIATTVCTVRRTEPGQAYSRYCTFLLPCRFGNIYSTVL